MWRQSANHSLSLWWAQKTAPWEFQTKLLYYVFTSNNKSNFHFTHAPVFAFVNSLAIISATLFFRSSIPAAFVTVKWSSLQTVSLLRAQLGTSRYVLRETGPFPGPRPRTREQARHQQLYFPHRIMPWSAKKQKRVCCENSLTHGDHGRWHRMQDLFNVEISLNNIYVILM